VVVVVHQAAEAPVGVAVVDDLFERR
jgi:hypothetical protein